MYRDAPDDPVGQLTCGVLSDPYRTRYVENPATGQQIDLIEIDPSGLSPRPGPEPAQGDLVIGIPADAPREALERVRRADPGGGWTEVAELPEEDGVRAIGRDAYRSCDASSTTTRVAPFPLPASRPSGSTSHLHPVISEAVRDGRSPTSMKASPR